MNPLVYLSDDDKKIVLSCYHAAVKGPFFHGSIWASSALYTYSGHSLEQLLLIGDYWPNLESKDFLSKYSVLSNLENIVNDDMVFKSYSGVNSILHWCIYYFLRSNSDLVSKSVIDAFREWLPIDQTRVLSAYERYLDCYVLWLRQQRGDVF